jgi:hypothetical protein
MKLLDKRPKFKLPEGYQFCEECDGWGNFGTKTTEKKPIPGKDYRIKKCKLCDGRGYLTWLEKIFGVNNGAPEGCNK